MSGHTADTTVKICLFYIIGLFLLSSCSEETLTSKTGLFEINKELDFGEVKIGQSKTLSLTIKNAGNRKTDISDYIYDRDNFSLRAAPQIIGASSTTKLYVIFKPQVKKIFNDELKIKYFTPSENIASVRLKGSGKAGPLGGLEISPNPIDFGLISKDQKKVIEISLKNKGPGDLKISEFNLKNQKAFDFLSSVETPYFLGIDSEVKLALRFLGTENEIEEDLLVIGSNDSTNSLQKVPVIAKTNSGPLLKLDPAFKIIEPGKKIILDASGSSDPEGDLPLNLEFELAKKPVNSTGYIKLLENNKIELNTDVKGRYVVKLSGKDSLDIESKEATKSEIWALPKNNIRIQLIYEHPDADADLHFIKGDDFGKVFTSSDCFFGNSSPNWGEIGKNEDDPKLDDDNRLGFGAENISLEKPAGDRYAIGVHYYTTNLPERVSELKVTLRIFIMGSLKNEITKTLSTSKQFWKAAILKWDERGIEIVDEIEDNVRETGR